MSDFKGGLLDYALRIIVGTILTVITFGIMYPWTVFALYTSGKSTTHTLTVIDLSSTERQWDFSEIGLNGGF